jgi:hypothetical protein
MKTVTTIDALQNWFNKKYFGNNKCLLIEQKDFIPSDTIIDDIYVGYNSDKVLYYVIYRGI